MGRWQINVWSRTRNPCGGTETWRITARRRVGGCQRCRQTDSRRPTGGTMGSDCQRGSSRDAQPSRRAAFGQDALRCRKAPREVHGAGIQWSDGRAALLNVLVGQCGSMGGCCVGVRSLSPAVPVKVFVAMLTVESAAKRAAEPPLGPSCTPSRETLGPQSRVGRA